MWPVQGDAAGRRARRCGACWRSPQRRTPRSPASSRPPRRRFPARCRATDVRLCDQTIAGNPGGTARSTVKTFDGVPIDVRVAFPPEPPSGPDGPYPLIMLFHGYAGTKLSLASMQPFLNAGYATFSMTTRGFGQSCGNAASRSGRPDRLCRRVRAPDGHALRGPRRAGAGGAAGGRGTHVLHADRCDRRLLRRRHVDGARRRSRTARCCRTARSSPGRARAARRCRSRPRRRRSRGPTWRTR